MKKRVAALSAGAALAIALTAGSAKADFIMYVEGATGPSTAVVTYRNGAKQTVKLTRSSKPGVYGTELVGATGKLIQSILFLRTGGRNCLVLVEPEWTGAKCGN